MGRELDDLDDKMDDLKEDLSKETDPIHRGVIQDGIDRTERQIEKEIDRSRRGF